MLKYEKLIMQRLRDIAGITKSTKRNEFKRGKYANDPDNERIQDLEIAIEELCNVEN